jgi:hemerythrin
MHDDDNCRSYIDHLAAEHRRIHRMRREMQSAIVDSVVPDEEPSFAYVVRILTRLREELEKHFSEEEAGGCLEEAVCRCPRLAADAKRIETEHPAILAEINDLIEKATNLQPNNQNQFAIQQGVNRLCRGLRAHEAAENQLLSQGFGLPVNGEHNEPTPVSDSWSAVSRK